MSYESKLSVLYIIKGHIRHNDDILQKRRNVIRAAILVLIWRKVRGFW